MKVIVKNGKKRSRVEYENTGGRYENGQFYEEELTDKALIATGKAVYDVFLRAPHETRRTKRLISWNWWGRCMGRFWVPIEEGEGLANQLKEIIAQPDSTYRDRRDNGKFVDRPDYPQEWNDYVNRCMRLINGYYEDEVMIRKTEKQPLIV
jgi:hypothetical protein